MGARYLTSCLPAPNDLFVLRTYQGEAPRVLVLSGGYPQPGWGVLVEWRRRRDVPQFEDLIKYSIAQLREKNATKKLNVFTEARQSFRCWQSLRDPPKLSVFSLESGRFLRLKRSTASYEERKPHCRQVSIVSSARGSSLQCKGSPKLLG